MIVSDVKMAQKGVFRTATRSKCAVAPAASHSFRPLALPGQSVLPVCHGEGDGSATPSNSHSAFIVPIRST
eukprot:COSAG06_NODE_29786_length_550_cov_1.057650_1_plen_70_part_10